MDGHAALEGALSHQRVEIKVIVEGSRNREKKLRLAFIFEGEIFWTYLVERGIR